MVMLVFSFLMLVTINALHGWRTRRRYGAVR